ncbi:hypothetical protein ACTU6V_13420 [Microbacterium sp. A204]|uniref:hypothetical protein n=1 Tax=Microbacterium sp. A204 TaxID=3457321 RepID=UPI003FD311CD
MDDSSAAHSETDDDSAAQHDVDSPRAEGAAELESATSTTLVEVTPGIAVVFGEVPEGLELFDLDLLPSLDRAQLNTALGTIGNIGTVAGNVAEAISSAQGLYRVNDATLSLLQSGGKLAAKDGAKLGAIFKNGELVAQARFIPASMTAATAIAAIGPAVAMLALQMQLGEISGLVRTNIALTTQTLKSIRNEQWSELEALVEAVDEAADHARSIEAVPDSVWDSIAASYPSLRKQMKLYRRNVAGYVQELGKLNGRPRRQYLESNAEAMVFDTYSLLSSLKAYAEYQAIKAVRARTRSADDESEAQLFERITRDTPIEIQAARDEIASLTKELVRELRIIAELPGRATMPLTKKRKDAKASQLTCAQLLEAIEPVANIMYPPVDKPSTPDVVCAPEDFDLDPYLQILRWFMEDTEVLQGIAFPHEAGGTLAALVPAVLARRVDASWDALASGRAAAIVDKFASSTFVAVTDQRIVTASPRALLREGELGAVFPLNEVRYVRPRRNQADNVRSTISVATDRKDITWMFPSAADDEQIDNFAAVVEDGVQSVTANQLRIEGARDRAAEENSILSE